MSISDSKDEVRRGVLTSFLSLFGGRRAEQDPDSTTDHEEELVLGVGASAVATAARTTTARTTDVDDSDALVLGIPLSGLGASDDLADTTPAETSSTEPGDVIVGEEVTGATGTDEAEPDTGEVQLSGDVELLAFEVAPGDDPQASVPSGEAASLVSMGQDGTATRTRADDVPLDDATRGGDEEDDRALGAFDDADTDHPANDDGASEYEAAEGRADEYQIAADEAAEDEAAEDWADKDDAAEDEVTEGDSGETTGPGLFRRRDVDDDGPHALFGAVLSREPRDEGAEDDAVEDAAEVADDDGATEADDGIRAGDAAKAKAVSGFATAIEVIEDTEAAIAPEADIESAEVASAGTEGDEPDTGEQAAAEVESEMVDADKGKRDEPEDLMEADAAEDGAAEDISDDLDEPVEGSASVQAATSGLVLATRAHSNAAPTGAEADDHSDSDREAFFDEVSGDQPAEDADSNSATGEPHSTSAMPDMGEMEETIRRVIREELSGEMGERLSRNIRKMIHDQIEEQISRRL